VSAAAFEVYPAIDVRDGRVVRLAQGDYARETRYDKPPFERARSYAEAGANWLHLVDLDAARTGGYTLGLLLRQIKRETSLRVQTGGGVRSERDVDNLLAAGADRVVVGSLATTDPARVTGWIVRYGAERITIALDARMREDGTWFPATHGWTKPTTRPLEDVLVEYLAAGLRHLLCTDIDRDGMLAGPNLALYAQLVEWAPRIAVQASGGARDADDVRAARDAGCGGIVLGRALLENRIDLSEALRC
jgi:phosphoribosylformimino-5-aminoimidazole carboxamide ribotide isomerase